MDKKNFSLAVCALAFLAAVVSGCDGNASAQRNIELGAATPEALMSRMQRAGNNQDMREMVASIELEGAREMAEGVTVGAAMMVAFSSFNVEEQELDRRMSELQAIFTRHGLPVMGDESPGGEAAFQQAIAGLDHAALANLVGDLTAFLESISDDEQGGGELVRPLDGDLSELVIDGDSASGRVGEDALEFVRIDGRWFAKMPEPAPFDPGQSSGTGSTEASDFWADMENRNRAGYEGAEALVVPISLEVVLDGNGPRWYRFDTEQSGLLRVATRSTGQNDGDLVIRAYRDENFGEVAASSDNDSDGDSANESIELDLQVGQVLHVQISEFFASDDKLSFHMEASFTPAGM